MASKFCSNCGKPLSDGFNFCPNCGQAQGSGYRTNPAQDSQKWFDIRDGVLVNYTGRASHVIVPAGVRVIGKFAFSGGNEYINKISFPDTVVEIESFALANCYDLTDVILPNGLTEIKPYTFWSCAKLSYVYIPSSVKTIRRDAFIFRTFDPSWSSYTASDGIVYHDRVESCPLDRTTIPESVVEMERNIHVYDIQNGLGDNPDTEYSTSYYGGLKFLKNKDGSVEYKCKLNKKYEEIARRINAGLCEYCGGKISFLTGKCSICREKKSYKYKS